jgi:hypothetical protein
LQNKEGGLIRSSITIILGIIAIVFSKRFAKDTSDFYYNLLHHRFSEKGYQIAFIIGGIVFIFLGILSLSGIIKYKA